MRIGVLGLQGDFREHLQMLQSLGVETLDVRMAEAINNIDGLIIPGGESTTLARLLRINGLEEPLCTRIKSGMPTYGTCAGAILLARDVLEDDPKGLDLIDISISRNAYGRQVDSFEAMLDIKHIGPFCGVFIRAPRITRIGEHVETLASFNDEPVLVREENILAGSFHPELTSDTRIHQYFANMIRESQS